jgi:hypothetical protein
MQFAYPIQVAMGKLQNRLNIAVEPEKPAAQAPAIEPGKPVAEAPNYTGITQTGKTKGAASLQPLEFW